MRSGDVPAPIMLKKGDPFSFTIRRGVSTPDCVSVNYDDFIGDVDEGDTILVDGTADYAFFIAMNFIASLMILSMLVEILCLTSLWLIALVFLRFLYNAGGMMGLVVKSKTEDTVSCEVVDGGELKSRRHLNVRGKSATLPSITGAVSFSLLKSPDCFSFYT